MTRPSAHGAFCSYVGMSAPVITDNDTPLALKSGELVNARWQIGLTDPATFSVVVQSSGTADPLVRVEVDWGDGFSEASDLRPVGRRTNYMHTYEEPGTYTIKVVAVNSAGTSSVVNPIPLRVLENRAAVVTPTRRWSGLALPVESLQAALDTVQNAVPVEVVSLAATPVVGERTIVVDGRPEVFDNGAQVSLTQPGKLITVARVVSRSENVITLDAEVNDAYTPGEVRVEVTRYISIRQVSPRANADYPWYFPATLDAALVKSAVRMILSTRPGERVMLPTFGSDLHRIPFEQNDFLVESLVRRATVEAIQRWEPRANVEKFEIRRAGHDIRVFLTVSMVRGSGSFTVDFALEGQP